MEQEIAIPDPKVVQTIMEYAKTKGVTRQTVYNHIKAEKIKTVRLGNQQFIEKHPKA